LTAPVRAGPEGPPECRRGRPGTGGPRKTGKMTPAPRRRRGDSGHERWMSDPFSDQKQFHGSNIIDVRPMVLRVRVPLAQTGLAVKPGGVRRRPRLAGAARAAPCWERPGWDPAGSGQERWGWLPGPLVNSSENPRPPDGGYAGLTDRKNPKYKFRMFRA